MLCFKTRIKELCLRFLTNVFGFSEAEGYLMWSTVKKRLKILEGHIFKLLPENANEEKLL